MQISFDPKFLTRGQTFKVVQGDSVVLPCQADPLGKFVGNRLYENICFDQRQIILYFFLTIY